MAALQRANIDVRYIAGRKKLQMALDECIVDMGANPNDYENFLQEPCTNPTLGTYIEAFGIDRICSYRGFTVEDVRVHKPAGLREEDVPVINDQIEAHLMSCKHCVGFSLHFLGYVDERMDDVWDVVSHHLDRRAAREDFGGVDADALQDQYLEKAYRHLVSVEQMFAQEQCEQEMFQKPCSSPKLWRRIEYHGLLRLAYLLPQNEREHREQGFRTKLTYPQRMDLLHELSEHVKACERCTFLLAHERKEEDGIAALYDRL
jgi:hypothetical protein